MTPPAHGRVSHTHTQGHKHTLVCVHALASADLQLLLSPCPAAVAVSWEGWLELLCGCLKQRLLTPVTPIPSHGALLLPASPFPSLPPGPGANMASNLLPTQEGQGPAGPCAFLSVGHVTVARLFFSLFFESVSGSQGGSWDQTVTSDYKKFMEEEAFLESYLDVKAVQARLCGRILMENLGFTIDCRTDGLHCL